jgi:hypothetical protein
VTNSVSTSAPGMVMGSSVSGVDRAEQVKVPGLAM